MPIFTPQTREPLNRFFKILRRSFLILIAIILLAFIAIQTEFVQNWLVDIATSRLSKSLGTEVSIKNVSFALFNRMNMEGILIRDKQKDTLLYANQLKVRITDWFFLKDKAELKFIGLEDALINMNRKDSVWNYQFIADYFSSPTATKKSGGLQLNLKKVDLKNVHFIKNDRWAGEYMNVRASSLLIDADNVDLVKNEFVITAITLDNPYIQIQGLTALRQEPLHKNNTGVVKTGMYFNRGNMSLRIDSLIIHNGSLFLDNNEKKPSAYFDGSHIELSKLNGNLANLSFIKDTLRAQIDLSVKDRCGLELKKLKTNFKLTPQIMELSKLDLQTNRSHLTNYYAMKFKDFNKDFANYNSKVIMDARFKEARVNSDDIAYFAPDLRNWKKEVLLSGNFLGTVDNFIVDRLHTRIGATTNINGNLSMKGLPAINTTKIRLTNGSLQTNYSDLGLFIPGLKGVTSPNLAALGTIIYKGNFNLKILPGP